MFAAEDSHSDPDSSKAAAAVYKKAKLRDLQVAEAGSTFPTHRDDEMKVICWMKFESLFLGDMCNQNKTCHVLVKACCNHRHVNFPFRRLAST